MPLSRSELVYKRRKDQKSRNKLKGKKKHKRLDAICEKAYNRSHVGVEKVESSRLDDGGNEMELRRSGRTRKAPVLLDSSPQPPKKRQKVNRSWVSSVEKVYRKDGVKRGTGCLTLEELDGENSGWRSRLRTREKNARISGRSRGESSLRGKRKLFEDFDGFKDITETHRNYKEDGVVTEKSTVVKSKRPGRIKASNVLANENQETDMAGDIEDHDENRDDVFELMDKGDAFLPGVKFKSKSEVGEQDGCIASKSCERGDTAVQSESQLEEYDRDVNLETREENYGFEKLSHDLVPDKRDAAAEVEAAEVDCAADQIKDEFPDKPLQDETHKRSNNKYYGSEVADHKSRIKLGRRCGLCGGGTDGKPPKVRVLDGDGSDNGAYSGSSTSEEPNYDVWDGFGDEPGWLGRLLGPINDRFGIAGIWVHQQCAVWSPEVYFAGLGCLKNVRAALYRGRVLKCSRCRKPGATIGCRVDRCPKTYHLPCARAKGCIFDHRKFLIACTDHRCLFQPHGIQNMVRLKKIKSKKMKLELRKMSNDAHRKDIEAEEKWLEKCGEDEEFLKRESKRLQRDLYRIAPVYIGGANSENGTQFQGWESVAGLQDVIQCMKEVVIVPLLYPEFFSNIGLTPPRGVLLHGYPGTGKTLVVRALVGSCARGDKRIAYFARKGADCLGKYVGDAERQLRLLFQVAEKSQPSIIFFDEIDGLAPCRTKQQDQTHNSVVSTLLALMDGLKSRGSVVVIGATNRPDAVDPALRRPGRFDREIYFPLPSVRDREAILSLHTQKWPKPITGSLLNLVAKQTIGFAGADLQALCTQAAIIALRKNFPLQEVLSAAETKHSHSKSPPIPNFFVEERDWLQALSCAPPPCSRREFGAVVNDVLASPLDTFLVPCLLKPLTRLLIHLSLDDRVWLPTPLINASKLVKNVIVSALSSKGVQSDKQWSQVDYLLQEVNVANEIEKKLLLANVLVSQTDLCSSDVIDDFNDDFYSRSLSSTSQFMGAHSSLQKNVSTASSTKTGYQVLISGNPRSGQRHLASCLLHCFLGNVDVWKVDLASISHEGHGDMIHGLTRILMRCSSGKFCMIYMPRIDLWAIDTCNEASEDHRESYSVHLQSAGVITCNGRSETARKLELNSSAEGELKKASCLWTSFIDQVELMRVNTSVIILATSEIPLSLFPGRVRHFFGDEVANCSLPSPLEHKVPRFCVQIDGKFDCDNVINSIAVKLSKDLARHFVQLVHNRSHIHENSMKEKTYDRVQDVTGAHDSKSSPVCPFNPVAITNKMVKGKSSLLLAISTLGYQILCYPHFAELCWVTSKLKAGPFANTNGPWKGWPFNSCVIGPINLTEQVLTVSGSSSVKSQFGVVRGLVAIGLSAYRGEYTSPREICSEVRKVLETLVGRVNGKIQAGKDKSHFIRILSQVAYLEDLVTSWAYSLQSLEVETPISQTNKSSCMGSLDNFVCKDSVLEGDGNMGGDASNAFLQESENLEALQDSEPTNCDNACLDTGDEIAITAEQSSEQPVSDHSFPVEHSSTPKDVENSESSKKEAAGDDEKFVGNFVSASQSNGFTESCLAPVPVNNHGSQLLSPAKASSCQPNSMSRSDNNVLSTNTFGNSGASDIDTSSTSKPASPSSNSSSTCIYQCCSECFANLYSILMKIIITEWGLTGGTDSTVEEVYHFVSSLSVKFNLALRKLSEAETLSGGGTCKYGNYFECQKCRETDATRYKNLEQGLVTDCGCHSRSKQSSVGRECSFIFSNNVLGSLDTGIDVPYHCKYEKLCLCFLIEWLVTSKEPFD